MPEKKKIVKKTKEKKTADSGSQNLVRWRAPDYYTFEKSPYWSLMIGLMAIVFSLVLIYTSNYFPVVIIVLAVIVTFQVSHEKPQIHEFAVDDGGVISRNVYFPYLELKSFWIAKHGNKSIIYLEPLSKLKASIVIPLGNQSQFVIRNLLLAHLPEKTEYGELLSEKLIRIFKL